MYQEVYWHKTVRGCEAMFKRFFYEYVAALGINGKKTSVKLLEELLCKSDDEFISTLYSWSKTAKNSRLKDLIQPFAYGGRKQLYKPAYIYFDHDSKEANKVNKFFRSLFTDSYKDLIEKSKRFSMLLRKYIPDIDPLDIIFEKTPIKSEGEKYVLDGFQIYNTRKKRYDDHPTEIDALNNYLSHNRQAYVFCHPRVYDKLKELSSSGNKTFQKLLTEM
jgi:HD superfamily phosphohydrolase